MVSATSAACSLQSTLLYSFHCISFICCQFYFLWQTVLRSIHKLIPDSKVIRFRSPIYQCGFKFPDSNSKTFVDSGFLLLWQGARQERLMTCCFRKDRDFRLSQQVSRWNCSCLVISVKNLLRFFRKSPSILLVDLHLHTHWRLSFFANNKTRPNDAKFSWF